MFRVHPETPIDFTESLFVQRPTVLKPAFAGMQVPAGTDEDFLRCVGKRIDWVMAAPIKCLSDLVEPFCAGSKCDRDVFDLFGFLNDDYPVAACVNDEPAKRSPLAPLRISAKLTAINCKSRRGVLWPRNR